jgi:hypothetical protein
LVFEQSEMLSFISEVDYEGLQVGAMAKED